MNNRLGAVDPDRLGAVDPEAAAAHVPMKLHGNAALKTSPARRRAAPRRSLMRDGPDQPGLTRALD